MTAVLPGEFTIFFCLVNFVTYR